MLRVTITGHLDGLRILDRQLDGLEARIADARPAWPRVLEIFQRMARETFDSEGASNAGRKWPELRPATIRQREREGFPGRHPILQRTGSLMRSVTQQTSDTILVQTPTYFAVGSAHPVIVYHQSLRPRKKLPRRAVVDFTTDQRHELLRPLSQYFRGLDPVGRRQTARP